jgi:outer membrane protein TolC
MLMRSRSLEVDIFGKFWRELEAATYDSEALAEARNWIVATVAADVARAYLDMRALQRELAVLRQNIKVAKDRFDYAKTRYASGSSMNWTLPWQSDIWRLCRRCTA